MAIPMKDNFTALDVLKISDHGDDMLGPANCVRRVHG